jgi:hypothetical protein
MNQSAQCAYSGAATDWINGKLAPKEAADFIEHLTHCPSCQEEEHHARVVILWGKCREEAYADSAPGLET